MNKVKLAIQADCGMSQKSSFVDLVLLSVTLADRIKVFL